MMTADVVMLGGKGNGKIRQHAMVQVAAEYFVLQVTTAQRGPNPPRCEAVLRLMRCLHRHYQERPDDETRGCDT
jgi:hypothetical protein